MVQISGTSGSDSLTGTSEADLIEGLGGNDRLIDTLGGGDQLDGGAGDDIVILTRTGPTAAANIVLLGGSGNDELRFTDDRLFDDVTIDGGDGNDRIFVDGGHRLRVLGGDGDDIFTATTRSGGGIPNDRGATLVGGAGADTFIILPDVAINPIFIEGAESIDRIDLSAFLSAKLVGWDGVTNPFAAGYLAAGPGSRNGQPASIVVDLDAGGEAFTFTPLLQFGPLGLFGQSIGPSLTDYPIMPVPPGETQTGTTGDDTLAGTDGADALFGGDGDDRIEGGRGEDRIVGGEGDNTLTGGAGSDTIQSGAGDDFVFDSGNRDQIFAGNGNNVITISGATPAVGGNSLIHVGSGDDTVSVVRDSRASVDDVVTIDTEGGNDRIRLDNVRIERLTTGTGDDSVTLGFGVYDLVSHPIDLGDGNDRIVDYHYGPRNLVLGKGRDYATVNFDPQFSNQASNITLGEDTDRDVVTLFGTPGYGSNSNIIGLSLSNFRGGSEGDVLDLTDVARTGFQGWDGVTNPFAAGYLSLGSFGSGTALNIDVDRSGPIAAYQIILFDAAPVSLTAANLGWAPDGSAAVSITVNGTAQDDALNGSAAGDTMTGGAGNDTLQAGFGNDTITGGAGSDLLIGGGGIDMARYDGLTREYSTDYEAGFGTVSGGPEGGIDRIELVEKVQFRDAYFITDPRSNAAAVLRLYDSVLDRVPDSGGLNGWVHAMDHGLALKQVALGFTGSIEFQTATGGLNNADFVEYLYVNALGRASDAAGKAGWVNALDSGQFDRGDVVIGFSESLEHIGRTLDQVAAGMFSYDENYAAVASLYDAFADRAPDRAGLIGWAEALQSGSVTLAQVSEAFASSAEFKAATAGLDNRGIVELIYRNALEREGDAVGVGIYTAQLNSGTSVGQVLLTFSQSLEHQLLMEPNFNEGIVFV